MMDAPYFWQQTVWDDLKSQFQASRLASAILIEALDGLGVNELLKNFIQQSHCQQQKTSNCPCQSCRWLTAGSHPDHLLIAPTESKTIKVDDIRKIQQFVRLTPSRSKIKTIWIESADKMNVAAQNALLKILEEPPAHTYLFLSAHSQYGLLPTILSRLYKLHLSIPPKAKGIQWCQSQGLASPENHLALSQGAPLLALTRAQDADDRDSEDVITDLIHVGQHSADMSNVVEKWKKVDDIAQPLYLTYTWLVDLAWLCLGGTDTPKYHPSSQDKLMEFVEKVYPHQLIALMNQWQKSTQAILSQQGANSVLHLTSLLIGWQQVVNGEYRVRN